MFELTVPDLYGLLILAKSSKSIGTLTKVNSNISQLTFAELAMLGRYHGIITKQVTDLFLTVCNSFTGIILLFTT